MEFQTEKVWVLGGRGDTLENVDGIERVLF